ncbi:MAG: crotonase/enoyl-CoA hydratase family protein [Candidatus Rokubacteria bacterium]|nr:crotonase/enoyl-CoA hydratase family protein [Candidatus Rokubacteria bacterium]
MQDRVSVTLEDGVADVRLNRPEKLNGLDRPMFEALVGTGRQLATNRSLRAVVLSGAGRAFCAGLDFASFIAEAGEGRAEPSLLDREDGSPANFAQSAAWVWAAMPVPVVAAVHGVAYGGGLQIALAADIRFVAPDARLSVMEIKWGLVPDMTGPQTLRHLVRHDVMRELTFTGRIVSGAEAVSLGLATHVAERPWEAAMALAREIAGKSPDAIRAAKRLLNRAVTATLEEGLRLEEEIQRSVLGRPNQLEAVQANLEKRAPQFRDPS